ncbi:YrzE family protein [Thermogemmatispora carboxidivorans]|uniref:YrzE family protein n=1 Tax=Thermogemmatispora carboxidivorans TaxID=1382306 RepID=UPI00069AB088|nr:YrzE family protein [Thermogemmatispora carboxidivorans]
MEDVHQLHTAAKGAGRPAEQVGGLGAEVPIAEPETVRVEPVQSTPGASVRKEEAGSAREPGRLPERGTRYALISGLLMGVLVALVTIVLVLVNAGLFNEAHRQVMRDALTVRVALLLAAIYGITWLVALIVAFIGGLILGRIAVRRRLGFLAGGVGGIVYSLLLWPTSFIPAYPGNLTGTATLDAGTAVLEVLWCLLWGLGGALVCLAGTWVASARHPHYRDR